MTPLLLALSLAAAEKPVVSVLYFENQTGDAAYDVMRKGLADMMVTDLVAWDGVTVVERARLEAVLGELKLQGSKAFDPGTAARVGKLLGAQYLVTGTMTAAGPGALMVDAKIVRVEKGDIAATARVSDQKDRIFDLEQRLVERLTEQIDLRIARGPERRKAFVPNMSVLVQYSNGLDLADQGKLDEANKVMTSLVSKNPLMTMARETRLGILKRLDASKAKAIDIVRGSLQELARRADAVLPTLNGPETTPLRIAWMYTRSALLGRALLDFCSMREVSDRVVLPGQEVAATRTLKALYDNELAIYDELMRAADPRLEVKVTDPTTIVLLRDSKITEDGSFPNDATIQLDRVERLLIEGRLPEGPNVFPTMAVLEPRRVPQFLGIVDQRIAEARRRWDATAPDQRARVENDLVNPMQLKAQLFEELERDEEAALAWQAVLDDFPTRNNSTPERHIREIAGVDYNNARSNRDQWRRGLERCEDMPLRVGLNSGRTYERMGLPGLDAIAADVEKNCLGRPGMDSTWDYVYGRLGDYAARHDDCARAKKYFLKQFTWGVGPRSLAVPDKAAPWCHFDFDEDTLPTKVHVTSFGSPHGPQREVWAALSDLMQEELGARGIPTETGGSSHGGVSAVHVFIEDDQRTLTVRWDTYGKGPAVSNSATLGEVVDVDALLKPLLAAMRPGTEVGPRKPNAKLPVALLKAYGAALELKPEEAAPAFEALAKQYPKVRMVRVRADMAAAAVEKKEHR